ncbi:tRNA pseudouridine(38-40) synthase TruA [Kineothrix sedimenti]|uniref:tRNA pseudouridine synthase A n=1 Tax=Kineothrix sedimenti TaxID=3123317 RepID=A0ABZ3EZM4_9FIRM
MRNIKVILQYEGKRYQGWQRQEGGGNTIQGRLEVLLTKMCGRPVEVTGSGRTDAGVHALGQTANFHIDTDMTPEEIMCYMNEYLPEDIAVIQAQEVSPRFHSRLNATGKTYCYRVLNSSVPHIFDRRYVYEVPESLDMEAMCLAAEILCGTHDYKAFTSTKKGKKSTVRTVEAITITRVGEEIRFTFKGNGFLYHMVRIMMGTLLEVGMHKREAAQIEKLFTSGRREEAGMLVPAKGLTLVEVHYS